MKNNIVIIIAFMSSISLVNAMKKIKAPIFLKKISFNKEKTFKNNNELSHILNPKTLASLKIKNENDLIIEDKKVDSTFLRL